MSADQTTPAMNRIEQEMLRAFTESHVCRRVPFWRRRPARSIKVVEAPPNGIGPAWVARCACGAQADIADVSSW